MSDQERKPTPPIVNATVSHYGAYLKEPGRPPSRGGNTRANHQHVLTIDGARYSFFALGSQRWVFVGDTVSFEWEWDRTERYRNVKVDTLRTFGKEGKPVVRGIRGSKKWRTAATRLPARRSEWRD